VVVSQVAPPAAQVAARIATVTAAIASTTSPSTSPRRSSPSPSSRPALRTLDTPGALSIRFTGCTTDGRAGPLKAPGGGAAVWKPGPWLGCIPIKPSA
jgi:hypothetical protein